MQQAKFLHSNIQKNEIFKREKQGARKPETGSQRRVNLIGKPLKNHATSLIGKFSIRIRRQHLMRKREKSRISSASHFTRFFFFLPEEFRENIFLFFAFSQAL